MSRLSGLYNAILLAFLLSVVLGLLLGHTGLKETLLIDEFLNLGHVPLFGVFSVVLLWVLNGRAWPVRKRAYYAISFSVTLLLGVTTEILQSLTPNRDFSFLDMARDAAGAMIFLTFAWPKRSSASRSTRAFRALALAVLVLTSIPLQFALLETWRMGRDFPLLDSFERRWETGRCQENGSRLTISRLHATQGVRSIKVVLAPGIYPGIALDRLKSDWSGYGSFSFDAFLEGGTPLRMTVRINDSQHDQTLDDRFNKGFTLVPGGNRITVDLGEVRKAPRGRAMDMRQVTGVMIFSHLLQEHRTLYFDNFRLEKSF